MHGLGKALCLLASDRELQHRVIENPCHCQRRAHYKGLPSCREILRSLRACNHDCWQRFSDDRLRNWAGFHSERIHPAYTREDVSFVAASVYPLHTSYPILAVQVETRFSVSTLYYLRRYQYPSLTRQPIFARVLPNMPR